MSPRFRPTVHTHTNIHVSYNIYVSCKFNGCDSMMMIFQCLYIHYCTAAVVGLEKTSYQVPENVGVVEVCAFVRNPTIMCPIAFPFNISFSTANITAGNSLLNIHVYIDLYFRLNVCILLKCNEASAIMKQNYKYRRCGLKVEVSQ